MIRPAANDVMIDVKMLVNPKNFYKVKRCVEITNPYDVNVTISGCQRFIVNDLATEMFNLKENVAIILQTLKNKCVIKVDPAQQDIDVVQEHLGAAMDTLRNKMKKSYDEVVALVVGGRAYDTSNKFADKGVQLTDAICEFMETEHIPSTKLLEQNLGRLSKGIDIHSHRKDAVISGGIVNDFASLDVSTPEQLQEIGEKYFDIFEVSPHAPVTVVDRILPKPCTNNKYI